MRSSAAILILIGSALCTAQSNPNLSTMRPGRSSLAALSFLFQGWPTRVEGVQFAYETRKPADCERYLVKLLDSPNRHQKELRDAAVFLASRLYVDANFRPYLVLSSSDALNCGVNMAYVDSRGFSRYDRLMRDAIVSYCLLDRRESMARSRWLESEQGVNCVRANVKALLGKLTVTTSIDQKWHAPAISR